MTTPDLTASFQYPDVIREVFDAVSTVLMKTGRVEIDGFGTFDLHLRKARKARNPRTGERIDLPAKTAVRFTPAAALKKRAATVGEVPRG